MKPLKKKKKQYEKDLEEFHFDEKSLSDLIEKYKKEQAIFDDEYFKIASQMYRFLMIIADKHPTNLDLQKVIMLKQKDFFKTSSEEQEESKSKKKVRDPSIENKTSKINSKESRFNDNIATSKFFATFIKQIEFNLEKDYLKKIFFIVEPRVYNIPESNIQQFQQEVPRSSPATKLSHLFAKLDDFIIVMRHIADEKDESSLKKWLYDLNYDTSVTVNFIIALIMNYLLLRELTLDEVQTDLLLGQLVIISYLQILVNVSYIFVFLYSKYPLAAALAENDYEYPELDGFNWDLMIYYFQKIQIYFLDSFFYHPDTRLIMVHSLFAAVLILNPQWVYICICQLFTIYKFVPTIRDLIFAFKLSFTQLLSMMIFLVILMFIYANIGFFYFYDSFVVTTDQGTQENICQSLLQCFITYFDIGVKSSGGIADIMKPAGFDNMGFFLARLVNDMIFYIIVAILVIYMINGIIIGSFSELREEHNMVEEDISNKCFICSIDKLEFEKNKISFTYHTTEEHNLLDYIYYMIMLSFVSKRDMDNDQSTVKWALDQKDINIFPVEKCSSFKTEKEEELEKEEEK